MSRLNYKKLGEVCRITYGKGLTTKQLKSEGYPVFGANGIIGFNDIYLYEEPEVLISCRGAYSGKINFSPPKCFVTNNSLILEIIDKSLLDKKFLFHILHSVNKSKLVTGTAQPQVTINNAVELSFPIPSIEEQQSIVSKIEELFSELEKGIEELKTAQQQLKVYRQAVLKWAFEGKLTNEWRLKQIKSSEAEEFYDQILNNREKAYSSKLKKFKEGKKEKPKRPHNIDPKNSLLEEGIDEINITPGWKIVTLVFISGNESDAIVDGPFGSSINVDEDYIEKGIPVIRMANIRPIKFNREKMKFISKIKFSDLRRHNILPGDVLISKVGATIGDCCLYPLGEPEAMLSTTGSCRIRVDPSVMNNKFLVYYVHFKKRTLRNIASQTAQPFLNMKVIKSFPVVLPMLIEQQQILLEIETRFSVCDKIDDTINNSLIIAEALRQSILKNSFEGKIA